MDVRPNEHYVEKVSPMFVNNVRVTLIAVSTINYALLYALDDTVKNSSN